MHLIFVFCWVPRSSQLSGFNVESVWTSVFPLAGVLMLER